MRADDGGAPVEARDDVGTTPQARRRLTTEVWLVLGLSLGQAGVYAAISLLAKLTAGPPLADQTATLNPSRSPRPYIDLTYQIAGIAFTLVPVLLALWLLSANGRNALALLGIDRRSPMRDLGYGLALAAVIGIPGLGLYAAGRAAGVTVSVVPTALNEYWWTVPVLILLAVKNAVLEEVIAVGYLTTRLRDLGWNPVAIVSASALLRGCYHLYQGFGPFVGNVLMGVVFAEFFRRRGRLLPLIIAHSVLDVVAFVGFQLFADTLGLR